MIYIDYPDIITTCIICKAKNLVKCNCEKITVYVNEGLLFNAKNKNIVHNVTENNEKLLDKKDKMWLQEYRKKKTTLTINLKSAFKSASAIALYPYDPGQLYETKES